MNSIFGYSVSKLKTMDGHEGLIMSGDLKFGKKKLANFFDDGNGGMMMFDKYMSYASEDEWKAVNEDIARQYNLFGIANIKTEGMFTSPVEWLVNDLVALDHSVKSAKRKRGGVLIYIEKLKLHNFENIGFGVCRSLKIPKTVLNEYMKKYNGRSPVVYDCANGVNIPRREA